MANKYYDPSGYPQTGAPGSSAAMRSELATIATGFEGVEQDIDDALTGASGAATTATAQAGIATTQAGISTTQAGIATTQAGISTTQAGIATTQAGIAADKAAEAAATKLAVDATYDEFDDRYLGRKASDPTVDNDGNALQEGTLYFNTTAKVFKGYNGTAWINLPATAASSLTFSPTGNISATNVQTAIEELDTEKLSAGAGAVGTTNLADGAVTGDKLESIVSGGSVGSESQIPVITYDTKGRITAITIANVAAPTVLNGTNDSTFASASDEEPVSPEWVNGRALIKQGLAVTTNGAAAYDFTGIPAGVKRITVMFIGVSTNGSSNIQMQIGTELGIDNTGYASTAFDATSATSTTGFVLTGSVAGSNFRSGSVTLTLFSGNAWVSSGVISRTDFAQGGFSSGNKTLSATLDRIRITTVNGTDLFDAGSLNISWEF